MLLQLVGIPVTALNVTVLVPWVAPKFVPVIVIAEPTEPELADKLVMLGVGSTVKFTLWLAIPPTVTTKGPVDAPLGTGTAICVLLQLVGVPAIPLKVIVLLPCAEPK